LRTPQQGYDIQLNQNLSDVLAAEQKARFARMDFEKFLGEQSGEDVIHELGLEDSITKIRQSASNKSTASIYGEQADASETKRVEETLDETKPVLLASLNTPAAIPSSNAAPPTASIHQRPLRALHRTSTSRSMRTSKCSRWRGEAEDS